MAEWDAMVEAMRHRPLEIEFRKSQVLTEEALEKLRAAQLAYTQKKLQEHQFMMQQMAMQAHETAMQQQQLYMQELHRAHLREELSGHVCREQHAPKFLALSLPLSGRHLPRGEHARSPARASGRGR